MKNLLIILSLFLFLGCSQKLPTPATRTITVEKIVIKKLNIPSQLLDTTPLPKIPKDIHLQSQVATYITNLYDAGSQCIAEKIEIKKINEGR